MGSSQTPTNHMILVLTEYVVSLKVVIVQFRSLAGHFEFHTLRTAYTTILTLLSAVCCQALVCVQSPHNECTLLLGAFAVT